MKHRSWVVISGLVWFLVGFLLLSKGIRLNAEAAFTAGTVSDQMKWMFQSQQQAAAVLIGVGLLIGFLKGRFVLVKTVRRVVGRIVSLPLPIRFKQVYHPSYYLLIGFMMALGMALRFLPIAPDLRGTIDIAVGSALIQGALLYFRSAKFMGSAV